MLAKEFPRLVVLLKPVESAPAACLLRACASWRRLPLEGQLDVVRVKVVLGKFQRSDAAHPLPRRHSVSLDHVCDTNGTAIRPRQQHCGRADLERDGQGNEIIYVDPALPLLKPVQARTQHRAPGSAHAVRQLREAPALLSAEPLHVVHHVGTDGPPWHLVRSHFGDETTASQLPQLTFASYSRNVPTSRTRRIHFGDEMNRKILRLDEISEATGIPIATLRWHRHRGTGPTTWRLGRRVVAYEDHVTAWVEEQANPQAGRGGAA